MDTKPCGFAIDLPPLPSGGIMRRSCGRTPTTVVPSATGYPLDLCAQHAAEERQIQERMAQR